MTPYLLRFAFGAGIAGAAGLIGLKFGSRFGGIFLAFPAILPASLTLIAERSGTRPASVDSEGAVLGGVALTAFAAVAAYSLPRQPPLLALALATASWLVVAGALYLVARPLLRKLGMTPPKSG